MPIVEYYFCEKCKRCILKNTGEETNPDIFHQYIADIKECKYCKEN
jgi:hypothetical protein